MEIRVKKDYLQNLSVFRAHPLYNLQKHINQTTTRVIQSSIENENEEVKLCCKWLTPMLCRWTIENSPSSPIVCGDCFSVSSSSLVCIVEHVHSLLPSQYASQWTSSPIHFKMEAQTKLLLESLPEEEKQRSIQVVLYKMDTGSGVNLGCIPWQWFQKAWKRRVGAGSGMYEWPSLPDLFSAMEDEMSSIGWEWPHTTRLIQKHKPMVVEVDGMNAEVHQEEVVSRSKRKEHPEVKEVQGEVQAKASACTEKRFRWYVETDMSTLSPHVRMLFKDHRLRKACQVNSPSTDRIDVDVLMEAVTARLLLYQMWMWRGEEAWSQCKEEKAGGCKWSWTENTNVTSLCRFLVLSTPQDIFWDRLSFHVVCALLQDSSHRWFGLQNEKRPVWESIEWGLFLWRWKHCPVVKNDLYDQWRECGIVAGQRTDFHFRLPMLMVLTLGQMDAKLGAVCLSEWNGASSKYPASRIDVSRGGVWCVPEHRGVDIMHRLWSVCLSRCGVNDERGAQEQKKENEHPWIRWILRQSEKMWSNPVTEHIDSSWTSFWAHIIRGGVNRSVKLSKEPILDCPLPITLHRYDWNSSASVGGGMGVKEFEPKKKWDSRPEIKSPESLHILAPCMRNVRESYHRNAGHLKDRARFTILHQWKKMGYTFDEFKSMLSPSSQWDAKHTREISTQYNYPKIYGARCKDHLLSKDKSDSETRHWCPFYALAMKEKDERQKNKMEIEEGGSLGDMEDWTVENSVKACREWAIQTYPSPYVKNPNQIGPEPADVSQYIYRVLLQSRK